MIEPGWEGYLTIEISNHSEFLRVIPESTPIAQVVFHTIDQCVSKGYDGKYQNAPQRAQEAIFEATV